MTAVEEKPYTRRPAAPFTTSTLQQEASRKLRLTSKNAMRVAQRLYENGYITYMRTDSTTLSEAALSAARGQARELYGAEYVPDVPRRYERKVKNAQEAHEAIRPAGDPFRTPAQVAGELRGDEFALYELIWKRTVASQMADARGSDRDRPARRDARRRPRRRVLRQRHGHHLPRLPRGLRGGPRRRRARPRAQAADEERRLPKLSVGDGLDVLRRRGRRPRDQPAGALHRGDAGQGAGGAGHRPPVDLRLDPRHDPGPRLRATTAARRWSRPGSRSR